ncbi:ABC transporter substrate-binding protein [Leeia sp.]|uniref:ABC transporter substrate-binding protein n=1 Tax=Leeia sp. TaxID=2884678 RepID=UPI0035AF905F
MTFKPGKLQCLVGAVLATMACSAFAEDVEVMHWWVTGGEGAAVAKFKEGLKAKGFDWKDMAVGASDAQRLLLKTRIQQGNPPEAAQVQEDIYAHAREPDKLANLDEVAKKENWDKVLPPVVQRYAKAGTGHYVVVPATIHRENVMWISVAALKKLGASAAPKTWDEYFALAEKAKKAGIMPVAGARTWALDLTFHQIAFGTMGGAQYSKAFYDGDDAAMTSPQMIKAFEIFRKLSTYADKGTETRRWNEATSLVIQDKALMLIMGDWAKGEFAQAKKAPNKDYLCAAVPGTENGHYFLTDAFIFYKTNKKDLTGQMALAQTILDKNVQVGFSAAKGSVPPRTDADVSSLDECAQDSYADYLAGAKSGKLVGSPDLFVPAGRSNAWNDVIRAFWANPDMSAQDAVKKMAQASKAS